VHGEGQIEFRFGTRWDGFEFVFETDALQAFVDSAQLAIADMRRLAAAVPERPTEKT
jgi:hypothetical protein